MVVLSKKPLLEKEPYQGPLTYEDYLDIESLANKLPDSLSCYKDGIYTSNRDIGRYTIHESQLVNMPVFYRTPEEVRERICQSHVYR